MNYEIIKEFLTPDLCRELVNDFHRLTSPETNRWHGGRKLIPKTSPLFVDLCRESGPWRKLAERLEDPQFSLNLMRTLSIKPDDYKFTDFYGEMSRRFLFLKRKAGAPVRNSHPLVLVAWLLYGFFIRSTVLALAFWSSIQRRKLAELFFDASAAENGYSREIHRDSDSRVFVFLLYLNSPKKMSNATGGELCLHDLVHPIDEPDPQPDECAVRTIATIEPEPGCLVVFENDETSYHSVPQMSGFEDERVFLYGSLTVLAGRALAFDGLKKTLPTDYKMYL